MLEIWKACFGFLLQAWSAAAVLVRKVKSACCRLIITAPNKDPPHPPVAALRSSQVKISLIYPNSGGISISNVPLGDRGASRQLSAEASSNT